MNRTLRFGVLLLLLFSCSVASAQIYHYDNILLNQNGTPVTGASVYVCAGNVTPNFFATPPCTLAAIYSDLAGTAPITQPLTTSPLGNYNFFLPGGTYTAALTGAGIQNYSSVLTIPAFPGVVLNASNFPTIQSCLNALTSGGTCAVSPGTYVGPTTIPSNVKLLCLAPPMSKTVAQTFAVTTNNVVDQCKLTYTSQLVLSQVQNSAVEGFILDFNKTGFGVTLSSTNFTHWTYNTFRECGNSSVPCLQLLGAGTLGTAYNTFDHNFLNPNDGAGAFATCILLNGSGAVNGGQAVTINKFYDTSCTGNVLYAVDVELNSDTNYFSGLNMFQETTPPANSAILAFNLNTPGSDQDADGCEFYGVNSTGTNEPLIRTGVTTGHQIFYTAASINPYPGTSFIIDLTGSQNWNFELHQIGPGTAKAFSSMPQLYMYGGALPSQYWLDNTGAQKFQTFLSSGSMLWNNGFGNFGMGSNGLFNTPVLTISGGSHNLPAASSFSGMIGAVSDSTAIAAEGQTCAHTASSPVTALAFSNGVSWKCF